MPVSDPHRSAPRRRLALRSAVIGLALGLSSPGSPARALDPLPFPAEFRAEVEEAFFDGSGRVDPAKVQALRQELAQRRAEVVSLYFSDQRVRGRGRKKALRKARDKKLVRVYDLLLGREGGEPGGPGGAEGWLGRLLREPDPVEARRLAARILEFEYALRVSGSSPDSVRIPENLASISVLEWRVPDFTDPKRLDREASNLVDPASGLFLEPEDLARLLEQGADLSRLDPPADSTYWRDPGAIASRDIEATLTRGGHPVHHGLRIDFPASEAELDGIKKSQTKPKFEVEVEVEGPDPEYKLKVGGEIHSEPVTGAILAALGFNADVTRHVKDFRMYLGDLEPETLRDEWRSYFEFRRLHLSYRFDDYFEIGEDERGTYALAREASLTAKPDEVVRVGPWPWGALGNQGRREARALGVISIWLGNTDMKEAENNKLLLRLVEDGEPEVYHLHHDLGHAFGRVISEQIEAFPWDVGKKTRTGRILFNYHSTWNPSLRTRITWADGRWAVRLLAQLTRPQIEAAVDRGRWPEPVGRLLVEKLVNRRNQLVELFELEGEETPSGPIALLPVDRTLTTDDGRVVDGHLVDGVFEGATQEFDNYWEEFIGPVWERAKLLGVGVFQRTVGLVPGLIFDTDSVGLPRFVVLRLLTTLLREVEENPRPTSDRDYYLVRDRMLLGVRVGGGLIANGTFAVWRAWTLIQPAGTLAEAHFAGDTILNLRLPFHRWRGELPRDFVLIRETYLDSRLQFTTQNLAGNVPPVGAEASAGLERLSRDMLVRRDGRLSVYEDVTRQADEQLEAFVNFVFVRIPFAASDTEQGELTGRLFELPPAARLEAGHWGDALTRFLRDGETEAIERQVPPTTVRSTFTDASIRGRLPFAIQASDRERLDRVVLVRPGEGEGSETERFVQVRHSEAGFWTFLDWGEDHLHTVSALARHEDPEDPDSPVEKPRMESTYFQRDRVTTSEELGLGFVDFVNEIGRPHGRLLDFSPALHTTNDRWGDLEMGVRVGYSHVALERLRRAGEAEVESALAGRLGTSPEDFHRQRRLMATRDKWKVRDRSRVRASMRRVVRASERTLHHLERARVAEDRVERMREIASAVDAASLRRRGAYDGRVLGVLHGLAGADEVSIEAVIQPPPWIENRLVGGVPLSVRTHERRKRLPRPFLDLRPECTAGLYGMLDGFQPRRVGVGFYGAPCDGARGSFTR